MKKRVKNTKFELYLQNEQDISEMNKKETSIFKERERADSKISVITPFNLITLCIAFFLFFFFSFVCQ